MYFHNTSDSDLLANNVVVLCVDQRIPCESLECLCQLMFMTRQGLEYTNY